MLNKSVIIPIIVFTGLILVSQNSKAQENVSDISEIKYLYDGFRFEETILYGQNILKDPSLLTPKQLGYIHQYLAFAYFTIGKSDSARLHFLSLLSISPQTELDPLETSPKIIDFFNQAKSDFEEINDQKRYIAYPEYVFIEDKRPAAAWRSAVLPGWGQYYKGQSTRAYILGGAFLTSAVVLGVSIVNENKYRDSYLSSSDPDDISRFYDKYNNWSKVRQIFTYSTIGIWLLSFADAIWSDYPKVELHISSGNYEMVGISVQFGK